MNGLYGIQADFGAYGNHQWRHALLGLDYAGNLYHYANNSTFDGSTHNLSLGVTYQQSRRVFYEMRLVGGTSSLGYGAPGFYGGVPVTGTTDVVNGPSTQLFDTRIYYVEPSMDMSFIQSSRTIYTFGGDGYFVRRSASGLASLNGYNLHGTLRHRISKTTSFGVTYEHIHYDFPPAFGQSDINTAELSYNTALGRRWTFQVAGGVFQSEVQGVKQVALNPVVAALLGVGFGQQAFYTENYYPSGTIGLTGKYKTSSITFSAAEQAVPGNGVYLTSRQQTGGISYSYTGIRKFNFGLSGAYYRLQSVGQGIQPYANFSGGVGLTYALTHAVHLIARADSRYQTIDVIGYNRTGYRASLGIGFSPGNVPLSLW